MIPTVAPSGMSSAEKIRFSRVLVDWSSVRIRSEERPVGFQIGFHGICFGARFIGALSAGNDEDGIRVISSIIKGCIQPESQSLAWTGGTHVGAKDDDIIKTRSRIQSGGTKNHTFHADKDQNAYCDKSKQNSPDAWRKLCKKVNME